MCGGPEASVDVLGHCLHFVAHSYSLSRACVWFLPVSHTYCCSFVNMGCFV